MNNKCMYFDLPDYRTNAQILAALSKNTLFRKSMFLFMETRRCFVSITGVSPFFEPPKLSFLMQKAPCPAANSRFYHLPYQKFHIPG